MQTILVKKIIVFYECFLLLWGMKTDKRGRKPKKLFKIDIGQLKKVNPDDEYNLRYRAKKEGWVISTRKIKGDFLVYRSA